MGQAREPKQQGKRTTSRKLVERSTAHDGPGKPAAAEPLRHMLRDLGNDRVRRLVAPAPAIDGAGEVAPEVETSIRNAQGGRGLDAATRAGMEAAFGADFGQVRVHTDEQADHLNRALQARAFTSGEHVFFSHGAYDPAGAAGRELLAHELTHVVQQGGGRRADNPVQAKLTVSVPGDEYEQEAEQVARAVAQREQQGRVTGTLGQDTIARQEDVAAEPLVAGPDMASAVAPVDARTAGLLKDVESLDQAFMARSLKMAQFFFQGETVAAEADKRITLLRAQYEQACKDHARIIHRARGEAVNQQKWIDVLLGLGLGIGFGMCKGVGDALKALGKVGSEVVKTGAKEAAKKGLKSVSDVFTVAGQDIQPSFARSSIFNLPSTIKESLLQIHHAQIALPLIVRTISEVRGDLRLSSYGVQENPMEECVAWVEWLTSQDRQWAKFDLEIDRTLDTIQRLAEQLASSPHYNDRLTIEQDIWIIWIAEKIPPGKSDILDLDEIEDYLHAIRVLGSGDSRLKVDFGLVTLESDERRAINAAQAVVTDIEESYRKLQ